MSNWTNLVLSLYERLWPLSGDEKEKKKEKKTNKKNHTHTRRFCAENSRKKTKRKARKVLFPSRSPRSRQPGKRATGQPGNPTTRQPGNPVDQADAIPD